MAAGVEGEALALRHLQQQGMTLVQRNYRVARGPGARADEVDLVSHNCARVRFTGSGAIHKWELELGGRIVDDEIAGSLAISDSPFSAETALDGVGSA